jgi:hypothetical protein
MIKQYASALCALLCNVYAASAPAATWTEKLVVMQEKPTATPSAAPTGSPPTPTPTPSGGDGTPAVTGTPNATPTPSPTTAGTVTKVFAEDNGSWFGDTVMFYTNQDKFILADSPDPAGPKLCAPVGSRARVAPQIVRIKTGADLQERAYFRMYFDLVTGPESGKEPYTFFYSAIGDSYDADVLTCGALSNEKAKAAKDAVAQTNKQPNYEYSRDGIVKPGIAYLIPTDIIEGTEVRRSGLSFGGLVVPFKYYLGGDRTIKASTSVAPYIGWRIPFLFNTTLTPMLASGLAMIPVKDGDGTNNRNALSVAGGVLLRSPVTSDFSAGIAFGKDFVSKSDRGTDETIDKLWASVFFGYAIKSD